MPRISPTRQKGLIGGLTAGLVISLLVVVPSLLSPNGDNSAQACNPNWYTNERLDELFRTPFRDGSSWEKAYVFSGKTSGDWVFEETTRFVIIQGCTFSDGAWGVRLNGARHVRVIDCSFINCTRGIWAREATDFGVQGSSFDANAKGMDLWHSSNCSVVRNEFIANEVGVVISSSSSDILVKYNQFDASARAASVGSVAITFTRNFYNDYFDIYPGATMESGHPDLGYSSPSDGAAFPLSVPVILDEDYPYIADSCPLWFVPNVTPVLSILSPGAGSCWRNTPVLTIIFSGTLVQNASYSLNDLTFPFAVSGMSGTISMPIDVTAFGSLGEGSFTVLAGITSLFGMTTSTSVSCVKDTVAPAVTIVSPGNGTSFAAAPTITLNVLDANPCGVSYSIGGTSYAATLPTFTIGTAVWAAAAEGEVVINVNVQDAAGNLGSALLCLNKDITGPVIGVAWVSGALVGMTPPAFTATASDPAGISGLLSCTVSGMSWSVASGSSKVIPTAAYAAIPDGSFSVAITATDALGNPSAGLLVGTKDTIFDKLEVLVPLAGAVVSAGAVPYFAIDVADGAGVVATWVSVDGGLVRYPVAVIGYLPSSAWAAAAIPGRAITITFGAMDAAGNNATRSVVVNVLADGSHGDDDGRGAWWESPLFWMGSTFGLLSLAIIVAITFGSTQKSKYPANGHSGVRGGKLR